MTITVFARLYFQLGEYEKAVDAYEKLQAQNEDNTVLFRAIGGCVSEFIVSDWGGKGVGAQSCDHATEIPSIKRITVLSKRFGNNL